MAKVSLAEAFEGFPKRLTPLSVGTVVGVIVVIVVLATMLAAPGVGSYRGTWRCADGNWYDVGSNSVKWRAQERDILDVKSTSNGVRIITTSGSVDISERNGKVYFDGHQCQRQ